MAQSTKNDMAGQVLEIEIDDSIYAYAQDVGAGFVFFDYRSECTLDFDDLDNVLNAPALFFSEVFEDYKSASGWRKIGRAPVRAEVQYPPPQFMRNGDRFRIYDPHTGIISAATYDECKDLERCAVWEVEHVEDRLRDHFAGQPNKWLESLAIGPRPEQENTKLG